MGKAILTPEGQSATFIELFFDLVFVFGVTQLVGLLHHARVLSPPASP
jgi:low temperature requirement protein LtrA